MGRAWAVRRTRAASREFEDDVTVRTLLVDDAPDVRAMLRVALKSRNQFEIVGEADNGVEAGQLADDLRPDVVVLDLGLPDLPARGVLAEILRRSPTSRIVIYSGSDADRSWFEERASSYVLKGSSLRVLLDALVEAGESRGPDEAALDLTNDVLAVRDARAHVGELLRTWGYDDLVDDAVLVVSELVTNAVAHADSNCAVVVNRAGGGVRIEVRDEGAGVPDLQAPSDLAEDGRGLMIVSALATAWGVASDPPTKTVWVELAAG
jgi:CheY-like chemotaxis protein/anti-sigma regulatory factor (Ser/Thr protein kinase)